MKRLKLRRLHSYLVDLDHHEITPAASSASSSWTRLLVKPPDAKRFSTSLKAHLAKKDLGPREKEDLQAKERSRWLTTLAQQLHDAGFPIHAELAGHSDPVRVLANVFGAKRYRTLRARSRQWAKITNWMRLVHGKTWTTEILELVDLGEDFFGESLETQPGKTIPKSLHITIGFMEQAGGVPYSERLSEHILWRGMVDRATARLQVRNTATLRAPPPTVAVLMALELFVVSGAPEYLRLAAWLKLVMAWASLRSADVQGIDNKFLFLGPNYLRGYLVETRTTGPGKKTLEVAFFVSVRTFLTRVPWLETGYQILQSAPYQFERDYFFPEGDRDLGLPRRRMADYDYLNGVSRYLSTVLKVPRRRSTSMDDPSWEQHLTEPLVPPPLHLFWKGHSDRHFLSSLSTAVGFKKEDRDFIGRWGIDRHQANDYLHSSMQTVIRIQEKCTQYLYEGSPGYDESELFHEMVSFLESKGIPKPEAELVVDNHRFGFGHLGEVTAHDLAGCGWGWWDRLGAPCSRGTGRAPKVRASPSPRTRTVLGQHQQEAEGQDCPPHSRMQCDALAMHPVRV